MAEGKFQLVDMKGLTPGVDPAVSKEIFALGGRNYVFDSRGAKSPFGDRLLSPVPLANPEYLQGVRLRLRGGDRCFHFVKNGIVEWLEELGGWQTIYVTPDTTLQPYRWTFEYLNGYLYFCHPSVGILVLSLDTGYCVPHDKIAVGSPVQAIAVSQCNGRLGVLTTTALAWSGASDGLDFSPALGGAGAQLLEERVPGEPIMLTSYSAGFLTWTTGGVMRSEFTGDQAVFRHRSLNTEYRPINPFCTARIDEDTVIILDERGLFQSSGQSLTPYSPLFNEFLIDFLQGRNYNQNQAVRIEWDDLQRRLYLSYSDSYANPIYENCFVYYPPLEKWGEFNELHYGIVPIKISTSERADDYFGFADSAGCVRYWRGAGSREKAVIDSTYTANSNLYVPLTPKPTQYVIGDEGRVAPAFAKARGFDAHVISQVEGYYADGSGAPQAAEVTGLNSLLRFGLFRLTGETDADEMSEVTSVVIRSVKSGESDVLTVDYNLIPDGVDDEDYDSEVGVEGEDFGTSPLNYVNHGFELIGTKDGDTDFVRTSPDLAAFDRAARFYTCSVPGVWHIAEISADSAGEAFHIRSFEFTGTSQGRLL